MDNNTIVIRGAREHNLRDVNLDLPRGKLIVFTGVSGSGKSSLAFDTLYAEGQRRYVESLSSYARQFMGQMQKPDVDLLAGLSPAISIQQKTASRNPRSTVGTVTEVYDYLRVLYARVGQGHCPKCGRAITAQTREQIIARVLALPEGTRFLILAPVVRGQKGEFKDLFDDMLKRGFVRARVDGAVVRLSDDLKLQRHVKHHIEIVIDRLKVEAKSRPRLAEAVEGALALGDGALIVAVERGEEKEPQRHRDTEKKEEKSEYDDLLLSAHYSCTHCDTSYEPPSPQLFSFNSPQGMCPDCDGLGTRYAFDPELLVAEPQLSLWDGAIPLWGAVKKMGRWRRHILEGVAKTLGVDLKQPWRDMPEPHRQWMLYGTGSRHITFEFKQRRGVHKHGGTWEGFIPQLMTSFKKTAAGPWRMAMEKVMRVGRCATCGGRRLNAQASAFKVGGRSLPEVCAAPIGDLVSWLHPDKGELEKSFTPLQRQIAEEVLKEIRGRLGFLLNVGLHYLTLDRAAPTLSGGEAQRIRLAGQIGCGLVGVLYILDEPSIGLHPRDNERLLRSVEKLRDMGNTVVVVEHDEDTMRAADYLVDFGPGPGVRGGEVVAAGTFADVLAEPRSLTGQYLSGKQQIAIPDKRRPKNGKAIAIVGAKQNNLKNIDVDIPLGVFVGVTGVSGSGKSSLVNDILLEGLRQRLGARNGNGAEKEETDEDDPDLHLVGAHDDLRGHENIDKVIAIDQSPIGRTPRSNPATYIKVFDEIRNLFAEMPEAKVRGYKPGRFSFNRPGGRCEACEGNGANKLEMDFLADVWVTCPVCEGRRFNRETLQVRYKTKSIQDVLEMDVQQALDHFANVSKIRGMLQTLHDVGLDYVKLGQASPTLSGGEAQRIKLARELCRRATGRTLYVLDEPTTGLHFEDIRRLLQVLHGFADAGNTVVVIEHNLDVLKTADWLIDLGPEGGSGGGEIVAVGTPEDIAACPRSFTGQALRKLLSGGPRDRAAPRAAAKRVKRSATPEMSSITVEGACQHNLKSVDVELPRERMSVFCGPSGSGKSSLALDTIYAEGQRRYIESLSAYARQFLGQMQKPKVDRVSGLSPAISIEQKTASKSPRSTVGTVTEVYDYLRILYARLGHPYCPNCAIPIGTQTVDEIVARVLALPEGTKLYLLAPLERKGQEKYDVLFAEARRSGFARLRIDGTSYTIDELPDVDHRRKHQVEVVVDRLLVKANQRGRIGEAVEAALSLGNGVMRIARVEDGKPEPQWPTDRYSQHMACDRCGRSFEPLNPHHFSFNSPLGWCPTCEGLGVQLGANASLLIRDPQLTLRQGAVAAWPPLDGPFLPFAEALARHGGFGLDTPYDQLTPGQQRVVLHGSGDAWLALPGGQRFQYKGLFPALDEAARVSFVYRQRLEHLVSEVPCGACRGSRLRDDAAAVRFLDRTLGATADLPVGETLRIFKDLQLSEGDRRVAGELVREVTNRLQFLADVGLDYLTLSRSTPTLSGGESQRIRLASQIGSGLTGVLYVLDEPTIGLHPRDNDRLLRALLHLRDLGNTLLLVEHDREVIAAADYLLDFGPGAGDRGGEVTARGTPKQVAKAKTSLTGQYLSGKKAIPVPTNRRPVQVTSDKLQVTSRKESNSVSSDLSLVPCNLLLVKGARQHNLKNIDVAFPLGAFVAVTGVSGSGKSSLVHEVLHNTLARKLHRAKTAGAAHDEIIGLDRIDKVISVDQDPIGNAPSSNPATYTGVFDLIRQLFAQLPESKVRGYHPRRFSFNKPGGRCEACEGNGQKKIEMHFLPDVWITCDVCNGTRYTPETLAVQYKGKSISDVLNMRVGEALELFGNIPKVRRVLQTLADVGLDYLALGQPAPTLSGGEAQRVKLAAELGRPNTGRTLYLLDEPTTGLHFDDIRKLLDVLNRLVDLGNTVIVVEHNLDVLKTADWIIDLGPEAGERGGFVVAAGTPEAVAAVKESYTGQFLIPVLKAGPHAERPKYDPAAAEAPRAGDVDLDAVGKDAKMPWEQDGRRWHTHDRVSHKGKPVKWDGRILDVVTEQIHELGDFSDTNWNHRTTVEIAAPVKSHGWFFHAHTGLERYTRLTFRVKGGAYKKAELVTRLGLKPFNDTEGTEVYGDEERVQILNHKPWQYVTILGHALSDVDTPAFRALLKEMVASFHQQLGKVRSSPEDAMPWKVNGERWHLGDKGFPPRRTIQWDRGLLPRLLDLIREVEPTVVVDWDAQSSIKLRVPEITRAWAGIRTKDPSGLDCKFLGKKGQFNLGRVEKFGVSPSVNGERDGADVLHLVFRQADQLHPAELKAFLKEHLAGFRETFGGRGGK